MADELRTVLGFEAADAIATLAAMETQLKSWTAAMRGAAAATRKFNRDAVTAQTTLVNLATGTQSVTTAGEKVVDSQQKVNTAVVDTSDKVEEGAEKVKKASKTMILSWQSVIRIFAIQTIHQAISKLTGAIGEGVEAARAYEIALAEIQTIAPEFRNDFEGLSAEVRMFSDAMSAPVEIVTEGVYQTLSNQVAEAGEAFQFMASAQAFATAAVTDTASSVNLLSSVINSYHMEVTDTNLIGAKLAKTIELGRIRGEEFANTVGRLTVLSAQLGISFDEVLASIATMTVSGMKWNEAFTLMSNIQLKLIRPTEELKERFAEMGIASAEAGIAAYGLQGFLDKITENSGSSASAIGEMFGRVRAIRGVLGLANENAELYIENLEKIQSTTEEVLKERMDLIFNTNAKQVEIELNRLRNLMVVDFGRGLNEIGLTFFETFGGGVETIKALTLSATIAGTVFITLRLRAIQAGASIVASFTSASAAMASFRAIGATLLASPVAWAVGFGAITLGVIAILNRGKAAAIEMRHAIEQATEGALHSRIAALRQEAKEREIYNKEILAKTIQYLQTRTLEYDKALKKIQQLERITFESITNQVSEKVNALDTYFNALEKVVVNADRKIKDLNQSIQLIHFDISDFIFEREIAKSVDPLKKAHLYLQRATVLRRKAIDAINKREFEIADAYNERAKATSESALQIADETKNRALIKKAEDAVKLAMQGQISVLKQKQKYTKDDAQVAEETITRWTEQREAVKGLNKDLAELIKEFRKIILDPDKVVKREEIKQRITETAGDIQRIFDNMAEEIDFAEKLKLEEKFKAAIEGIRDPIAGKKGKITIILDLAIDRYTKQLSDAVTATSEAQQAITGLVGAVAPVEQQKRMIELVNMLNRAAGAELEINKAQSEINSSTELYAVQIADISNEYETSLSYLDRLARSQERVTKHLVETTARRKESTKVAIALAKAAQEEIIDPAKIAPLQRRLEQFRKDAAAAGEKGVVGAINTYLENINSIIEGKQRIAEIKMSDVYLAEDDKIKIQNRLEALKIAVENGANVAKEAVKGVGPAALEGAEGVANAHISIINALKQETEAARQRNAELAKGGGGGIGKQLGGLIYRAEGGFTPKGTDTIPAMLSPGEFVVNADATRKFFSQLVAINSGVKPQYHAVGGSVTNIGDINITVNEAVSAKATARETMAAFRREKRKYTSKL